MEPQRSLLASLPTAPVRAQHHVLTHCRSEVVQLRPTTQVHSLPRLQKFLASHLISPAVPTDMLTGLRFKH